MPKSKEAKTNNTLVTAAEEVFLQELLKGNTQRKAYLKAYPSRANWKPATLDTQASLLFKKEKIRKRYDELLFAFREEEVEKTQWTREQSIKTLRYVIDKNQQDLERIQAAADEEIDMLLEQIRKEPEKAEFFTQLIIKQRKQRRISAIHNGGIVDAVSELNKMQGYNEENINMNGTVCFSGRDEIPE